LHYEANLQTLLSNFFFQVSNLPRRYKLLLGLAVVLIVIGLLRILRTFWLIHLGRGTDPMCPYCGSQQIRKSQTTFFGDRFYRLLGFAPYRCRVCYERFFRSPLAHHADEDEDPQMVLADNR
jgi:hypothetical protein